jgi:hypothetical protein
MSDETFDITQFEETFTERDMVAEATSKATVRRGNYLATIKTANTRVAGEKSHYPGRYSLVLQVEVQDGTGKTINMFQDVSWELYRELVVAGNRQYVKPGNEGYHNGLKIDKLGRLWSELEKIFNPDGALSIADVREAIVGSEVQVYVIEGLQKDDDMIWVDAHPKNYGSAEEWAIAYDADKAEKMKEGYIPKNFISKFTKPKEA